jgi:hypothetical protein
MCLLWNLWVLVKCDQIQYNIVLHAIECKFWQVYSVLGLIRITDRNINDKHINCNSLYHVSQTITSTNSDLCIVSLPFPFNLFSLDSPCPHSYIHSSEKQLKVYRLRERCIPRTLQYFIYIYIECQWNRRLRTEVMYKWSWNKWVWAM